MRKCLYYIYKMTSPSGKVYVGITNSLERRKKEHKRSVGKKDKTKNLKITNAIKKYGFDNMNFEHICTAFNEDYAKELEVYFVKKYDSYRNGYNLTWGGDSNPISGKLNLDDIEEIRNLLETSNLSLNEIGNMFNVKDTTVLDIQHNRRWNYLGNARPIFRHNRIQPRGSQLKSSKLDENQVKDLKLDYMNGMSRKDLQNKYEISKSLVQQIVTENIWTHVKVEGFKTKKVRNGNAKLDVDTVRKMWKDRKDGMTQKQIWEKYEVSRSTVQNIFSGKIWKDVYEEMK